MTAPQTTTREPFARLDAPDLHSLTRFADGSLDQVYPSQFSYYALTAAERDATRVETAVALALVVAKYNGDQTRLLTARPGAGLTQVCEAYVRTGAEEAEGNTYCDTWNGPMLITSTVHSMGLLDDYLRMKRGDQWMAFGFTEAESDAVR